MWEIAHLTEKAIVNDTLNLFLKYILQINTI